jgi:hypothetical protein
MQTTTTTMTLQGTGIILPLYVVCVWMFFYHRNFWHSVLNKIWPIPKDNKEDFVIPPIPKTKFQVLMCLK